VATQYRPPQNMSRHGAPMACLRGGQIPSLRPNPFYLDDLRFIHKYVPIMVIWYLLSSSHLRRRPVALPRSVSSPFVLARPCAPRSAIDPQARTTCQILPLSSLESALVRHPRSVHYKGLTATLTLLESTLTKNRGGSYLALRTNQGCFPRWH
jgi:hypothetical protein